MAAVLECGRQLQPYIAAGLGQPQADATKGDGLLDHADAIIRQAAQRPGSCSQGREKASLLRRQSRQAIGRRLLHEP